MEAAIPFREWAARNSWSMPGRSSGVSSSATTVSLIDFRYSLASERNRLRYCDMSIGYPSQASLSTWSTNSVLNGFRMKALAPASAAAAVSDSWPRALHITTRAAGFKAMISLSASMPVLLGMTMSRVVRSGRNSRYLATASSPSDASATTSYPSSSTRSRSIFLMNKESSTIMTVVAIVTSWSLNQPAAAGLPRRPLALPELPLQGEEQCLDSEQADPARLGLQELGGQGILARLPAQ